MPRPRQVRRLTSQVRVLLAYAEWKLDAHILNRRSGFPREAAAIAWLEDQGLDHPDRNSYSPSSWGALGRILPPDEVGPDDVFIDIGCGMGRVVFEAARYPFKRVIGVDISPAWIELAREAIARNSSRLRCRDIELAVADATTYRVPDDVTVAYLANPLEGDGCDALLARIFESVDRRPRRFRLIYVDPREQDRLEATGRVGPARLWRRGVRRWEPKGYIRSHEVLPAPLRS